MSKEAELVLDIQEIEKLEAIAQRHNLQQLLSAEKLKLQNEIRSLQKVKQALSDSDGQQKPKIPTVKITSYAWDQSDKFVKIYLSNLTGIKAIEESNITLTSEDNLHCLTIHNLNGKRHVFNVPKLAYSISDINFKVKTDMILLLMKKSETKNWKYLTEQDKIIKSEKEKPPPMDKNDDPSSSIMNMMKKMYDEGDDDMKRTIAKAWTESRNKEAMKPI